MSPSRRFRIAALVLGLLGAGATGRADDPDVIDTYLAVLKDGKESFDYRRRACTRLGEQGPRAARAIPALVAAMKDPELGYWAACALRGIGPDARAAVRGMKSPPARFRLLAELVTSDEAPFRVLTGKLAAAAEEDRFWVVDTLVRVGRAYPKLAPEAAGKLAPVARDDKDAAVRAAAAFAVADLTPDVEDAAVLVTRILNDRGMRPTDRAEAAGRLGRFAANARLVEPALLAALGDPDPAVRLRSAQALGQVSRGDAPTIESLHRLAVDAAATGYPDLYEAAMNATSAVARRVKDAADRGRVEKLTRTAKDQADARRARPDRDVARLQAEQLAAKLRHDQQIFGAVMCYGRQAHQDDAAHCARLAAMYQGSAEHWSALGETDAAKACAAAAERYDRWATAHREAAAGLEW